MRKLAWLMALLMTVCLSAALAENARPIVYKSGEYQYILLEDGTAEITRYGGRRNAKLDIPAELDGHRVTAIGDRAFYECESLKIVTIPGGVTVIGNYAFYECESLTSVTLPESVTSIGDYAFYECEALKSVTIPDSVTSIGKQAFGDCSFFLTLTVGRDSYAHQYAVDNGIRFTFPVPLD